MLAPLCGYTLYILQQQASRNPVANSCFWWAPCDLSATSLLL